MAEPTHKVYLGDSVYVAAEFGQLVLTTWNGYGDSNRIVLEPEVYEALVAFVAALKQQEADRG